MPQTTDALAATRFRNTRMREGYDQDEVDAFQHAVVTELHERDQRILILEQKLAAAEADRNPLAAAEELATASTNNLLSVARRLYDSHVAEGLALRDAAIGEGKIAAARLISESESHLRTVLSSLNGQHEDIQFRIATLLEFEKGYRTRLNALVSGQLAELDKVGLEREPVATAAEAKTDEPFEAPVFSVAEEDDEPVRRASFLPPSEAPVS